MVDVLDIFKKYNIGYQIHKTDLFKHALKTDIDHFQIFLGSMIRPVIKKFTEDEIKQLTTICASKNVYVHSAYMVSLSSPLGYKTKEYAIEYIQDILHLCDKIGVIGFVIHAGYGGIKRLQYITSVISKYVKDNQIKCKILIETPSDMVKSRVKDNIFDSLAGFIKFYKTLDKNIFKIAYDTAHVYLSGYDPYEALLYMEKECKDCVYLCHFNNVVSDTKDEHTIKGMIHDKTMLDVSKYCFDNEIPMIYEKYVKL